MAEMVLEKHPDAFGSDFEKNKESLESLALVSSKQLRNRIAGHITRMVSREQTEEPVVIEEQAA